MVFLLIFFVLHCCNYVIFLIGPALKVSKMTIMMMILCTFVAVVGFRRWEGRGAPFAKLSQAEACDWPNAEPVDNGVCVLEHGRGVCMCMW